MAMLGSNNIFHEWRISITPFPMAFISEKKTDGMVGLSMLSKVTIDLDS
jgi:hypothetical protein